MISDEELESAMRAKWFGRPEGPGWQYEAIDGRGQWHVMRFRGERRECVRIVPTRADADQMIRQLKADDARARENARG